MTMYLTIKDSNLAFAFFSFTVYCSILIIKSISQ